MASKWSKSLIPTARQVPAEAEVPSHQLMLRAGIIRKLGAGLYDYLPLGLRSLHKAMAIVREEMGKAGAIEVLLPAMVPIELYQKTGRDQAYGDNLFRVKDRHGRENALGPTHEEIITELVGAYVESYKQLPLTLYQIQTKFRDEFRPRFGVLRSREFQMKDAYSFHTAVEGPGGLNEIYDAQYAAYERIFKRCGLPFLTVEAESGPIGGSASHEFMVPSPTGEDTIFESDKGNYAANVEKCETGPRSATLDAPPVGELAKVHTPGCPGIDDVAKFMKTKPKNMLKSLVFEVSQITQEQMGQLRLKASQTGRATSEGFFAEYVIVIVRGDHDVNEGKLNTLIKSKFGNNVSINLAEPNEAKEDGFAIGYVGPQTAISHPGVFVFVDPDAAQGGFWVTGANEPDHHVKYFNWKRDVIDPLGPDASQKVVVVDIRNAVEGDPSPKGDGGLLRPRKGIEIGHVFKLGDKYSKAMGVTVLLPDNSRINPIMGCYGIGINRILAAAIERDSPGMRGHDENGIIWPAAIAPYQVVITTIRHEGTAAETADRLAKELEAGGADVLIDDRDERPGVKFKDADLLGIPVRITIGDKALATGQVEVKARNAPAAAKAELIAIDVAAKTVLEMLKGL
ncbi:MAG: proline--tRNA ligase [Planctomycetota bacterium]|nr:proline--tRNA ligase [Planctomycetota bacterium]